MVQWSINKINAPTRHQALTTACFRLNTAPQALYQIIMIIILWRLLSADQYIEAVPNCRRITMSWIAWLRGGELMEGSQGLYGQATQVQEMGPCAEGLRDHDRDPGTAHLPDEEPGRGRGSPETVGQDCKSGYEILGAWERDQMPPSPAPATRPLLLPVGLVFQ